MAQRDYYFDNGKFLLIFFVVFGHFIRSLIDESLFIRALYNTIYTFHMPAFILISGYFASPKLNKKKLVRLIKRLLIPYFIFQTIYIFFYHFLISDPLDFRYFYPEWSLWFLLSLFFWHLLLSIFARFKPALGMVLALFCGIGIGYLDIPGTFLSISRTFVFFPFFLLGYYMNREHFKMLRSKVLVFPAINILLITFFLFYAFPDFDFHWLFGSKVYAEMETVLPTPALKRLVVYLLSVNMIFSFFVLVPEKQYRFTFVGKYTLYVYLLHGFFIRIFRTIAWPEWLTQGYFVATLSLISLALIFFLSSKYIRLFAQPLVELRWTKLKQLWKHLTRRYRELHT